jgi:hypothetical protein
MTGTSVLGQRRKPVRGSSEGAEPVLGDSQETERLRYPLNVRIDFDTAR